MKAKLLLLVIGATATLFAADASKAIHSGGSMTVEEPRVPGSAQAVVSEVTLAAEAIAEEWQRAWNRHNMDRGMLVENPFRGGSDIASLIVYRTAVEIAYDGKKPKEFRLDPDAKLEQLLIRMAEKKKILPSGVLDHIKSGK